MKEEFDPYEIYRSEQSLEQISPLLWRPQKLFDWKYGIVVRVNGSTAMRLYGDYFHWLTYTYMVKKRDKKGGMDFSLDSDSKVHLYSCDDSSFGIWLPVDLYSNFSNTWSKLLGFLADPDLNFMKEGLDGDLLVDFCMTELKGVGVDYN